MKKIIKFIVLSLLIFGYTTAKSSMTIEFKTSGNCSICKDRIETALNQLTGVISSNWSATSQSTTVTYNETIIDAFTIMHAVADVGHDTEWYQAPQEAYDLLVGTCCEYDRVLKYLDVIIGYLSLMDIYVFPLNVELNISNNVNQIYPNPSCDVINISLTENIRNYNCSIFNNAGQEILKTNVYGNSQIDLSAFVNGQYLIIVKEGENIILKKKIQKI